MYDETAGYAPGSLDDFFKRLSETNGTPDKPFYMPNGTPFYCTASGTLLKKGLKEWATLPEPERKPGAVAVPEAKEDPERIKKSRRLTKPPPGALILRTYIRGLKFDDEKKLIGPKIIDWESNIKLPAEPNRDFLWLQENEWKSLLPLAGRASDGKTGPSLARPANERSKSYAMPDAIRDRICFWHIAGGYHSLPGYYTKDRFKSREMTLTIEETTAQAVTLRLAGLAELTSGAIYRFHGNIRYDHAKKAFTCFDLIALCDEGQDVKPRPQNVVPFRHYGIAFELPGERTDDLLPPFYLRENVGTPENYFGNRTR